MAADTFSTKTNLYVVQIATGPIKVGIAANVAKRLYGMTTANPYDPKVIHVQPGSKREEMFVHRLLRDHKLGGEWFLDSEQTRKILNEFFERELPYRWTVTSERFHGHFSGDPLPPRREPGKRLKSRPAKTVRRKLADGTIKEYHYPAVR